MSPLWPDHLAIGLAPDRVALLRTRGWRRQLVAKSFYQVPAATTLGAAHAWEPALATLSLALHNETRWQNAKASVVLANSFVRYQLLPASDAIASPDEEAAYVQASFAQIHGEASADWIYALALGRRGGAWVASAIDKALLNGVEASLRAAHCSLASLMPHLAPAFNEARRAIKARDLWFVQVEAQKLVVALLMNGRWRTLQTRSVSAETWDQELLMLLEREWRLQGLPNTPRRVFIASSESAPQSLKAGGKWQFEWLRAKWREGYAAASDAAFALALGI